MRFSFRNELPLAGFAARSARKGDMKAPVVFRQMLTTEDGELLASRLMEISKAILAKAPPGVQVPKESQIDNMIALVHRDGGVNAWVNDVNFHAKAKVKRSVAAGEPVMADDLVDIAEMVPEGISFPDDAGYIVLISVGWRKGLVFDFSPVMPPEHLPREVLAQRPMPVTKMLAGMYTYLQYRNRFIMTEEDWNRFFASRWFPFTALPGEVVDEMVNHAREGWDIDDVLPRVLQAVKAQLPDLRKLVASSPMFQRHRKILSEALDAFERGEHALAVAAMYPRIEGILRERYALREPRKPNQADLASTPAIHTDAHPTFSLLLPARFSGYLSDFFFGYEDFTDPTKVTRVTRHAVSHGVASDQLLDAKAAAIGVLVIQQLAYLIPSEQQ